MSISLPETTDALRTRLSELAREPVLLVASDYDGSLAELVADPLESFASRKAMSAVGNLVLMPQTHAAVISSRALDDLVRLTGAPPGLLLAGSHGSERDASFAQSLTPEELELMLALKSALGPIADADPDFVLESRPAGYAFHYRSARAASSRSALPLVLDLGRELDGVYVRQGKNLIELSVRRADKGRALDALRREVGATATLYLGDDATDEDAFATLEPSDVGVKIGAGETRAAYRVAGTPAVAELLETLHAERQAWLSGSGQVAIESLSLLSDQRGAALIDPAGGLAWCCAPRIDSAAVFAGLLDPERAGRFEFRPVPAAGEPEPPAPRQRYLHDSLVLETRWRSLRLIDYLDASDNRCEQQAARSDLLRVIDGRGIVDIVFEPRLEFGQVETQLVRTSWGLQVSARRDEFGAGTELVFGGQLDDAQPTDGLPPDGRPADGQLALVSPGIEWHIEQGLTGDRARARVKLDFEPIVLELRFGGHQADEFRLSEHERRLATIAHWQSWIASLRLPERWPQEAKASALILKGLHHAPSGVFAAAATTSLPRFLGGQLNHDERCSGMRTSVEAARALLAVGSGYEAMTLLDWLLEAAGEAGALEHLPACCSVTGQQPNPERALTGLAGYAGSRPVRTGRQPQGRLQLDAFGPLLEMIHELTTLGAPLDAAHWELVSGCVRTIEERWREPDRGLWNRALPERHYVHTKVICWQAVDRALRCAPFFGVEAPAGWQQLASEIAAEVLERGWKSARHAFGAAYDGDDLDSSALWIGLSGLLSPTDERFVTTLLAIERELRNGVSLYRQRAPARHRQDGLLGQDAGELQCTTWLVEALARSGRRADAEQLFSKLLQLAGRTGSLAEQWCPRLERALGNAPSTAAHAGLLRNALLLCTRA